MEPQPMSVDPAVQPPTTASASAAVPPPSTKKPTKPTNPPNQTLYINNLNDKINLTEIKKGLYHVLGQYGNIVSIYLSKRWIHRGQAFVVYDKITSATAALNGSQGFLFFKKPLHITYAKVKSDVVSKVDGTFIQRPKRQPTDSKIPEGTLQQAERAKRKQLRQQRDATDPTKKLKIIEPEQPPTEVFNVGEPNKILFAEHLPPTTEESMLDTIFISYSGYQNSRLVPGRNVAFIEFEGEKDAGVALTALQGFKITPEHTMRLSYAKR